MEIARLKTRLEYGDGGPGVNTMYFRNTSGSAWGAIAQQLIQNVADGWAELSAKFPTTMSWTVQPDIDIISAESGLLQLTVSGNAVTAAGENAGGYGPLAAGVAVAFHTSGVVNGKRVRGRAYIVPVAADFIQTDGTPATALCTAASLFGSTIANNSTYGKMVVYSRKNEHEATGSAYDVTTVSTKDTFAIMRSRRPA